MIKKRPKTIQFFLPEGEPLGIKIADMTTEIIQAIFVPRNKLANAADRKELRRVGVYFLFGEPEGEAKPVVYIGEAENCYKRLEQQNARKDFWQKAVAIVSKTGDFTKAHAKYLEWYCIKKAKEVGRFALDNSSEGSETPVTEPMLADLMDAFDTLNILTSALGFPLFEPRPQATGEDVFVLSGPDCEGRGQLVEDGFTVFAGSKARKQLVPSAGKWLQTTHQELLANGVLVEEGNQLVFKEDHTFKTPSGAAMALMGRTANGWKEWKSKFGGTLDELKRRSTESDDKTTEA
jgi:hypothetical protein